MNKISKELVAIAFDYTSAVGADPETEVVEVEEKTNEAKPVEINEEIKNIACQGQDCDIEGSKELEDIEASLQNIQADEQQTEELVAELDDINEQLEDIKVDDKIEAMEQALDQFEAANDFKVMKNFVTNPTQRNYKHVQKSVLPKPVKK